MKLATAYSTAIKYSSANSNDIQSFLNQIADADSIVGLSHPAYFLADYLQDNDDPRHLIVRKEMEQRELFPEDIHRLKGYNKKLESIVGSPNNLGYGNIPIPIHPQGQDDRALLAYKLSGPLGNAYSVFWHPKINANKHIYPFEGVFTPEEFKQFLNEIGSHQTIEDFQ